VKTVTRAGALRARRGIARGKRRALSRHAAAPLCAVPRICAHALRCLIYLVAWRSASSASEISKNHQRKCSSPAHRIRRVSIEIMVINNGKWQLVNKYLNRNQAKMNEENVCEEIETKLSAAMAIISIEGVAFGVLSAVK
jgi:hypothetical protein